MRESKIPRYSRTFYKYFFSYILMVMIILMFMSALIFRDFFLVLNRNVTDNSTALLRQVQQNVDIRLQELLKVSVQIQHNADLSTSTLKNGGYASYRANRELVKYKAGNEFIFDILLYYPMQIPERVFAASGIYSLITCTDYMYRFAGLNSRNAVDVISGIKAPVVIGSLQVYCGGYGMKDLLTVIQPLSSQFGAAHGAVVFLIEAKSFVPIVNEFLYDYSGQFYVVNEKGSVMVSLEDGKPYADYGDIPYLEDGVHNIPGKSREMIGIKITSEYNKWAYLYMLESDALQGDLKRSRINLITGEILILLLGILTAYLFALQNYKPLARLSGAIGETLRNPQFLPAANEFDQIQKQFKHIVIENQQLSSMVHNQSNLIRSNCLGTILHGKYESPQACESLLQLCGLEFGGAFLYVVVICINNYEKHLSESGFEEMDACRYCIINAAEELSAAFGSAYGVKDEDQSRVSLIMEINDERGFIYDIKHAIHMIRQTFRENFGITITAGISRQCINVTELHNAYNQACEVCVYQFLYGTGKTYFHDDFVKCVNPPSLPNGKINTPILLTAFKDSDEILKFLTEPFEDMRNTCASIVDFRTAAMHMCDAVMQQINLYGFDMSLTLRVSINRLRSFSFETYEEYFIAMRDLANQLFDICTFAIPIRNPHLTEELTAYANEHFSDPSISLEVISEKFSLSPSYVTNYFKKQTGYTLMKFIDMKRMEKARSLLLNSKMTIKEIVADTGYNDVNNFIRRFKKEEGVTPMHYRIMNRK